MKNIDKAINVTPRLLLAVLENLQKGLTKLLHGLVNMTSKLNCLVTNGGILLTGSSVSV